MRAQRAAATANARANSALSIGSASWTPLGPVPLASDASGNGTQDYHQVAGRATAVVIDPADPSGNTVYIGGAQSGIWKTTNGANPDPSAVAWNPLTDDQATLSIGALAIQPGNSSPTKTVILASTGEANNSADSYFGLGILRSADAGQSWTLITTANGGALSFAGLGGTRMAFSSTTPNTVVAAMAASSEGITAGAVTANSSPGLYTSLDAGQSWTYDAVLDAGVATDATSATSVAYNSVAQRFFAALRYHGIYSSPDGVTWTRLSAQPGGALLSPTACPPQSTSNASACPIYRAELAVVPGRNEMYAWVVSLSSGDDVTDGGIWQSINAGASWASISDGGIINCGDIEGCGVEQGSYNLELLAVPNALGTDLYAGGVNLYKCSINPQNPTCSASAFLNLTHAYGCIPAAAPAHVHPGQHALDSQIPSSGSDSGDALLYFANDGGIYRALDGFSGLNSGGCSGSNHFDDLNQNLGSMTELVSFSQHPSDVNTLLGGTQDNGSPATNQATTGLAWGNVLGGDGGYNAIDSAGNFYASNPDIPPGGLAIQHCSGGVTCTNSSFTAVVTSASVGGDDGAFYFPYILDPQLPSSLLVGTCRVWRGPPAGGPYTVLSPNFETYGSGMCSGDEVNQVRAIAAGGPSDDNGSTVIYATTSGYGPVDGPLYSTSGGHVWVTTNASAGPVSFVDVTNNGPQGSINPNQFPVSGVAIDSSRDPSGQTAFVTIMGFTGGSGHVWQTKNAGLTWTDFTANLPDSPVNAVVVDAAAAQVYVGTDVGVFVSSSMTPQWTEVGPVPGSGQAGFLPNVAVTALAMFQANGQDRLRASTYGRGMWELDLLAKPNYQLSIPSSTTTVFAGQTATLNGTATASGGYSSSVTMGCIAGSTPPPATCSVAPSVLTPGSKTPFTVTAGGTVGDYSFNVQGVGADPNQTISQVPVTVHIVGFGLTTPSPSTVNVARGTVSAPVSFQVTATGSFNQSVTLSCSVAIANANCTFAPGATVNPTAASPVNAMVTVTVPAGVASGNYPVTIQANTVGAPATLTAQFMLQVTANPDFTLAGPTSFPEVNAGSTGTKAPVSLTALDGFSGTVALTCSTSVGVGVCSLNPTSLSSFPGSSNLTINGTNLSAGSYSVSVSGTSGSLSHSASIAFNVGDFSVSGTQSLSSPPSSRAMEHLTISSLSSYSGNVNAACDASALTSAICTLSPGNPINVSNGGSASLTATISVPSNASSRKYNIKIAVQDTTGTPAHIFTVALTVGQDFIVTSSTPSQTISAGQTTGPYNLTVQAVGSSFNAPVTLACSGLPAGAQCSFNPSAPVTPGSSGAQVIMSISTTGSTSELRFRMARSAMIWLMPPGILLVWFPCRRIGKSRQALISMAMVASLGVCLGLLSCGGASSGGGGGGGGGCAAAPTVPTGLASSSTSSTATTLTWNPSSAVAGCSVGYVVYKGGTQLATVAGATYNVTGLSAATQYSFTVAATDSAGTSAQSTPVNVTTLSSGTPPGVYTITVTGSSASTPSDAGQSTKVQLVVN